MISLFFIAQTDTNAFHCSICSVTYSTRETVEAHVRQKHLGERPHLCKTCNLSFAYPFHRDEHQKSCVVGGSLANQSQDPVTTQTISSN
jgi:hypothetical protein